MKIISITSAKGGVGRSMICANLAKTLANNGYKVGLMDFAKWQNLDILVNAKVKNSLENYLLNECEFADILNEADENFYLITGDSRHEMLRDGFILGQMRDEFEGFGFDFVIADCDFEVGNLVRISDELIIVTTPDPASVTNTYIAVKTLSGLRDNMMFFVNFVNDEEESVLVYENLRKLIIKNIDENLALNLLGYLKFSKNIENSVSQRELFADNFHFISFQNSISRLLTKMKFKALDKNKNLFTYLKESLWR